MAWAMASYLCVLRELARARHPLPGITARRRPPRSGTATPNLMLGTPRTDLNTPAAHSTPNAGRAPVLAGGPRLGRRIVWKEPFGDCPGRRHRADAGFLTG